MRGKFKSLRWRCRSGVFSFDSPSMSSIDWLEWEILEFWSFGGLEWSRNIWNEASTWAGGRGRLFIPLHCSWPLTQNSARWSSLRPDNPVCRGRIIRPEYLAPDNPPRIFPIIRGSNCELRTFWPNRNSGDRLMTLGGYYRCIFYHFVYTYSTH